MCYSVEPAIQRLRLLDIPCRTKEFRAEDILPKFKSLDANSGPLYGSDGWNDAQGQAATTNANFRLKGRSLGPIVVYKCWLA